MAPIVSCRYLKASWCFVQLESENRRLRDRLHEAEEELRRHGVKDAPKAEVPKNLLNDRVDDVPHILWSAGLQQTIRLAREREAALTYAMSGPAGCFVDAHEPSPLCFLIRNHAQDIDALMRRASEVGYL